jgi:hypothetical protein
MICCFNQNRLDSLNQHKLIEQKLGEENPKDMTNFQFKCEF